MLRKDFCVEVEVTCPLGGKHLQCKVLLTDKHYPMIKDLMGMGFSRMTLSLSTGHTDTLNSVVGINILLIIGFGLYSHQNLVH